MDSLLTNAQRCSRKSDAYLKYGLYDDAYLELEKSLAYLNKCKQNQITHNNVDLVKVLIEQIDGKLRVLSLKKELATRKNNLIDSIIKQKDIDSAVVILNQSLSTQSPQSSISNGTKLHKDDKSIIEELKVTNTEYKKLNSFLIDEISQLKHENSYLKEEMKQLVNLNENNHEQTIKNEAIDLSKYIDSDEDDNDADYDDDGDIYKRPIEFTVDSS
jgi:tetratricopeptide (TPR) repeat protein